MPFPWHTICQGFAVVKENSQTCRNCSGGTKLLGQARNTQVVGYQVDEISAYGSVLGQKQNVLWLQCKNQHPRDPNACK